MESFEFLGARYNRPEQIMSGPVQTFKAQNAVTGKIVFIHRVSTTEAPLEQAAILKLLTTALVKSSEAKRLVVDFGEEHNYWYVVTENEAQCSPLREWLQAEVDAASNQRSASPPAQPVLPPADPGEFSRYVLAKSQNGFPAPATPPARHVTGEFTNFFSPATSKPQADPETNPEASPEINRASKPEVKSEPPVEAEVVAVMKPIPQPDEVKPPTVLNAPAIPKIPEIQEPIITIPQHVSIRPPDDLKFLAPRKKSNNRTLATVIVVLVVLALAVIGVMMFLVQNK